MLLSYLTVAIRSLFRNKTHSAINILGLSVGIACCLLVSIFVRSELSYDTHHSQADRIYRVHRESRSPDGSYRFGGTTSDPLAEAILSEIPEVEAAAGWRYTGAGIRDGERLFNASFAIVDTSLFTIVDSELEGGGDPLTL
jgi:putative ABC transport system permease protein